MEATDLQARFQVKDASKMQLYSCNTPNGIKVAACLEELCIIKQSMGETFDYEAHTVDLRHAETRRWTGLFPTGKIPVLLDPEVKTGSGSAVEVFESGSILLYLAEKYGELLPKGPEFSVARLTALNWLFWGSSTFSTACKSFGFYHQFCHENLPYCRHRYTNEVLRLFGVLEQQLMHGRHWIVGGELEIVIVKEFLSHIYKIYSI